MCLTAIGTFLAANAGTIGAVAGGVGAASSIRGSVMAGKDARSRSEAAARAEATAAQSANSRLAQRRTALKRNSLLTGDDMTSGMPGGGRATTGGA